ncbi:MAG: GNAT family N-acetyltransferase [Corallococcus sp.]|nr:GNAT family N-acetyltransferase [Corallococcus sp.]
MKEIVKNNYKVKLVETEEELYAVRRLRYEELICGHRNPSEITFEESFTDEDRFCDNMIVVDTNCNKVVGSYRFITKEIVKNIDGYYSEWGFNIDCIKNQPYNILELGKAAVHHDYRNGSVIKMMLKGANEYAKEHDVKLLFGIITMPEMEENDLKNVFSYLYHISPETDPTLQPVALEPNIPMDALPFEQVDVLKAKRQIPTAVKPYLALGCTFASTACPYNKLLHHADMLIMLNCKKLTSRYAQYVLR